jgi:membrane protease YdiL (CAAX protease family)
MYESRARVVMGVLIAIAVTTTLDASHLSAISALPLCPIAAVLWRLDRFSREAVGMTWGRSAVYTWAVTYPVVVMALLAALAVAASDANVTAIDWSKGLRGAAVMGGATIVAALLTEEFFFRGWLWAALERCGLRERATLVASSAAFAAWHISAVVLPTGFDLPARQIPTFLASAFTLGLVWGLIRLRSGSIVASSVCHGIWNGLAYSFFGFGTKSGAFGIEHTAIFGPEVGVVGLALNLLAVALLWLRWRPRVHARPAIALS